METSDSTDEIELLEDAADLDAARRALAEPGDPIAWATLKAELEL